jgi:hypothetical protein
VPVGSSASTSALVHQRARNRHALLATEAASRDSACDPAADPLGAAWRRAPVRARVCDQPALHGETILLQRREVRQQMVVLENEADLLVAELRQVLLGHGQSSRPSMRKLPGGHRAEDRQSVLLPLPKAEIATIATIEGKLTPWDRGRKSLSIKNPDVADPRTELHVLTSF